MSIAFFTRLPARRGRAAAPRTVMLGAPAVGVLLAVLGALPGVAVLLAGPAGAPWLAATCSLATVAYLTRGLHLDGLADFADGLGSARAPAEAVAVMQRSDIGPFGVMTLVLALALQIAALGGIAAALGWRGLLLGLAVALVSGRAAALWLCRQRAAAAPGSRLGSWVAGTVPTAAALSVVLLVAAAAATLCWTAGTYWWSGAAAVAVGLSAGHWVERASARRFGGITGDVLGAAIELAGTSALLLLVCLNG